jgi:hypothetical protein
MTEFPWFPGKQKGMGQGLIRRLLINKLIMFSGFIIFNIP